MLPWWLCLPPAGPQGGFTVFPLGLTPPRFPGLGPLDSEALSTRPLSPAALGQVALPWCGRERGPWSQVDLGQWHLGPALYLSEPVSLCLK